MTMKATLSGILYLSILLLAVHLSGFVQPRQYTAAEALRQVKAQFQEQMAALQQRAEAYEQAAQAFQEGSLSLSDLQQAHLSTRKAFKTIELLLEYHDREAVKKYLNGPPLLSVEPKVPEVNIIEPVGLQVLDELVFGNSPQAEAAEIARLAAAFRKEVGHVKAYLWNAPLQHRFVFEAYRLELIRIFSLGLTGFDTPGSGAALPEAAVALAGANQALMAYLPLLEAQDAALAQELRMLMADAAHHLQQADDFGSFSRLEMLKQYINPLFRLALEAQEALEVELLDEVSDRPSALNFRSANIFANGVLNASYYANMDNRALTDKRAALGKLLFFDPILSHNNERSCASCHQPGKAFSDGLPKSLALNGEGFIQRNAPGLINSVYAEHYFYDLREPNLERQVKHVVRDSREFNTDFLEIIEKLGQSHEYRQLFAEAYAGQPQYVLSKWSISNALAAYVSSLASFDSPFDQYVRGEREDLEEAAKRGFDLFMGKANCGTCHFAPAFNGTVPPYFQESESEVLGVPKAATGPDSLVLDPDLGRFASYKPIDQTPFYRHSFKTTTVRNAALTAPYMHNGVYASLEEVVRFYNLGGGAGMGITVPYQTLPDTPLGLTEREISDLVAFMESLTDTAGLTSVPQRLPAFEERPEWDNRPIGGAY